MISCIDMYRRREDDPTSVYRRLEENRRWLCLHLKYVQSSIYEKEDHRLYTVYWQRYRKLSNIPCISEDMISFVDMYRRREDDPTSMYQRSEENRRWLCLHINYFQSSIYERDARKIITMGHFIMSAIMVT
jgi:hypothetical protein